MRALITLQINALTRGQGHLLDMRNELIQEWPLEIRGKVNEAQCYVVGVNRLVDGWQHVANFLKLKPRACILITCSHVFLHSLQHFFDTSLFFEASAAFVITSVEYVANKSHVLHPSLFLD